MFTLGVSRLADMITLFLLVIGLKRSHTAKPSNAGGTVQSLSNGMGGGAKVYSLAPECPVRVNEAAMADPWSWYGMVAYSSGSHRCNWQMEHYYF